MKRYNWINDYKNVKGLSVLMFEKKKRISYDYSQISQCYAVTSIGTSITTSIIPPLIYF